MMADDAIIVLQFQDGISLYYEHAFKYVRKFLFCLFLNFSALSPSSGDNCLVTKLSIISFCQFKNWKRSNLLRMTEVLKRQEIKKHKIFAHNNRH